MNMALASFLWGFVGFAVFFGAALFVLRCRGSAAPVPRLALLGLFVHGLAIPVASLAHAGMNYWYGAALYWFLFNSFLFVFSAVYKSVSLRILWELNRAGADGIPVADITARYVAPLFHERISILILGGMAHADHDRFQITAQGSVWANRFALVQKIFGVTRGGLYGGADVPPRRTEDLAA